MATKRLFRWLFGKLRRYLGIVEVSRQLDDSMVLSAKALIRQVRSQGTLRSLHEAEFRVFSQFGDDGIIQYLIDQTEISAEERVFIEFGVEKYVEANTRFLLINDNWRGLIMDGGHEHIAYLQDSDLCWRHDITAISAFIDAENINSLISDNGFAGPVGILSIDIDGNDYWVWAAIDAINPVIVIVEYNSVFGKDAAVTVPYDPVFARTTAHWSNLYWGASLGALDFLANKKGYILVGCNSAGNNAYFIRRDRLRSLSKIPVAEAYVSARFRESRNPDGSLSFLRGSHRIGVIKELPVCMVGTGQIVKFADAVEGADVFHN